MSKIQWVIFYVHVVAAIYAATMYSPGSFAYFFAEGCIFVLMWHWALELDKSRGFDETFFKKVKEK